MVEVVMRWNIINMLAQAKNCLIGVNTSASRKPMESSDWSRSFSVS